ncbi:MAG: hypothetical protein P8Y94_00840 [Acidobacteriota bacterium]
MSAARRVLTLGLVFVSLTWFGWAGERQMVGQVVLAGGNLKVAGYPAATGTTLFAGDHVATGSSPVVLILKDGRRIGLASGTQAILRASNGGISVDEISGGVYLSGTADATQFDPGLISLRQSGYEHETRPPSPSYPGSHSHGPPFHPPGPPHHQPPFNPPGPPGGGHFNPPGHGGTPPGHGSNGQGYNGRGNDGPGNNGHGNGGPGNNGHGNGGPGNDGHGNGGPGNNGHGNDGPGGKH